MVLVLLKFMTIDQLNDLSEEHFVNILGEIYEHSPWVARTVWHHRPFADLAVLTQCMRQTVDRAPADAHLDLLLAHPDLAGKLAQSHQLSDASTREQAGLGLDRLSPEDFTALSELNEQYRKQFGFPFIICVRLVSGIPELLETFRARLSHDAENERRTALQQVHAIARLRLQDLISG